MSYSQLGRRVPYTPCFSLNTASGCGDWNPHQKPDPATPQAHLSMCGGRKIYLLCPIPRYNTFRYCDAWVTVPSMNLTTYYFALRHEKSSTNSLKRSSQSPFVLDKLEPWISGSIRISAPRSWSKTTGQKISDPCESLQLLQASQQCCGSGSGWIRIRIK